MSTALRPTLIHAGLSGGQLAKGATTGLVLQIDTAVRPGGKIPIGLSVSPEGIVELEAKQVEMSAGERVKTVGVRGVASGSAQITITVPAGFTTAALPVAVTVN